MYNLLNGNFDFKYLNIRGHFFILIGIHIILIGSGERFDREPLHWYCIPLIPDVYWIIGEIFDQQGCQPYCNSIIMNLLLYNINHTLR